MSLIKKNKELQKTEEYKKEYKKIVADNEPIANKVITRTMHIIASVYLFAGIFNFFDVFSSSVDLYPFLFAFYIVLVLCTLPGFIKSSTPTPELKYISLFVLLLSIFLVNIMFGYKFNLLYALPIVLSIRFYNKVFTNYVTLGALTFIILSAYTNAYLSPFTGILDLNLVSFSEPGTLSYYSWLHSAVISHGFDPELILSNGLLLSVLPTGLILISIWSAAQSIISHSVKMLIKEDEAYKKELQLVLNASTDAMTGLFNRRTYDEDIASAMEGNTENLVYVMFDADGLKAANDTLGHIAGDELIVAASQCIKDVFGPYGRTYRYGGDEFAALIYADDKLLDKIKSDLQEKISEYSGKHIGHLSISAGYVSVSELPSPFTIEDMEKLADDRMYKMKKSHHQENTI